MVWMTIATSRLIYPRENYPISIVYEAEWEPGPVSTDVEYLVSFAIRSQDSPARSESLYRLSYAGLLP